MAPTVSELGDRRAYPFSLEEQLHRVLRLSNSNDPLRARKTYSKTPYRLTTLKVMGLVIDQGLREGGSSALPSSNCGPEGSTRVKQEMIDLTVRTMLLVKRNQALEKKLNALQHETRALLRSHQLRSDSK